MAIATKNGKASAAKDAAVKTQDVCRVLLKFNRVTHNWVRFDCDESALDLSSIRTLYIAKSTFKSFYTQNGDFPSAVVVIVQAVK